MLTFLILIACGLLLPNRIGAQQSLQRELEIKPEGKLWFEGKASIVHYRCNAESLSRIEVLAAPYEKGRGIQRDNSVQLSVKIPVKSLDCGKRRMNRDMYEALKADRFSHISFRLLEADPVGQAAADTAGTGWIDIEAQGMLEIAGVADTTSVAVQGMALDENQYRVRGSKQINMLDYNVKPPTAMLGLIKADEYLTVHFDISVKLDRPLR